MSVKVVVSPIILTNRLSVDVFKDQNLIESTTVSFEQFYRILTREHDLTILEKRIHEYVLKGKLILHVWALDFSFEVNLHDFKCFANTFRFSLSTNKDNACISERINFEVGFLRATYFTKIIIQKQINVYGYVLKLFRDMFYQCNLLPRDSGSRKLISGWKWWLIRDGKEISLSSIKDRSIKRKIIEILREHGINIQDDEITISKIDML